VQRVDRGVGLGLTLLALLVLDSARHFPNVPGQKVGAGFLPMLVGAGLLVCGLALMWRSRRAPAQVLAARAPEQVWPALVVVAAIAFYVMAAQTLGFLLVAPLVLLAVFRTLRVAWRPALLWALCGTLVVHLVFYKLLRVPLPWGVIRPFF
jgi:putative tricarboxylic transport membrane protein